jgi:hypothetical protein
MEIDDKYSFQADSELVNFQYVSHDNYLIEYDDSVPQEYCIIYFSSNDLYFPNTEIAFRETIVEKNRFEWYRTRVPYGHKHIFLRDLKKQWYLTGVNAVLNTPEKLILFLKEETIGYKVVTLGSSAGGFNSIIVGQSLAAEKILSFNGQFEILSLLSKSTAAIDPIVFRNRFNESLLPYYDTLNFVKNPSSIFYFHSNRSNWDKEQFRHAEITPLNKISFVTSNHGVPFLKTNLPFIFQRNRYQLLELSGKTHHPIIFSIKVAGFMNTLLGLKSIIQFALNKIYINTIQKWKT